MWIFPCRSHSVPGIWICTCRSHSVPHIWTGYIIRIFLGEKNLKIWKKMKKNPKMKKNRKVIKNRKKFWKSEKIDQNRLISIFWDFWIFASHLHFGVVCVEFWELGVPTPLKMFFELLFKWENSLFPTKNSHLGVMRSYMSPHDHFNIQNDNSHGNYS